VFRLVAGDYRATRPAGHDVVVVGPEDSAHRLMPSDSRLLGRSVVGGSVVADQRDQLLLVEARVAGDAELACSFPQLSDRPPLVGAGSGRPEGSSIFVAGSRVVLHTGPDTRDAGAAKPSLELPEVVLVYGSAILFDGIGHRNVVGEGLRGIRRTGMCRSGRHRAGGPRHQKPLHRRSCQRCV